MSKESRFTFFRQSGWLVLSTVISGIFLMGVLALVQPPRLSIPDYGTFLSMLRFFTVLGIFTAGLQVVMAQDAAAALTVDASRELSRTVRSVARAVFLLWIVVLVVCLSARGWLQVTFKISFGTLLVTLGLVLAQLFLPFVQGLMQGQQQFGWLGGSIMMNGVGRFLAIWALLAVFARDATTALGGALAGLAGAVFLGAWPSRKLLAAPVSARFHWREWLIRAVPLTVGTGSLLFLMNADVLFVQAYFKADDAAYYSAVAVLGVGLVSFTTPMAAVMFPKLVRSVAQSERSDSQLLAFAGTAVLGLCAAIFLTLLPSLPLRILLYKNPKLWVSSQLVPWFMWSMLPMTLANVMVGSLLARRDFRAVPFLALIALGYGFELKRFLSAAQGLELFTAFKGVILRLGIFSGTMLLTGVIFNYWPKGRRQQM